MSKLFEAAKDLYTTIPATIAAIFAILKMFNLLPASVADELPHHITEIILSLLSVFMIFKSKKA